MTSLNTGLLHIFTNHSEEDTIILAAQNNEKLIIDGQLKNPPPPADNHTFPIVQDIYHYVKEVDTITRLVPTTNLDWNYNGTTVKVNNCVDLTDDDPIFSVVSCESSLDNTINLGGVRWWRSDDHNESYEDFDYIKMSDHPSSGSGCGGTDNYRSVLYGTGNNCYTMINNNRNVSAGLNNLKTLTYQYDGTIMANNTFTLSPSQTILSYGSALSSRYFLSYGWSTGGSALWSRSEEGGLPVVWTFVRSANRVQSAELIDTPDGITKLVTSESGTNTVTGTKLVIYSEHNGDLVQLYSKSVSTTQVAISTLFAAGLNNNTVYVLDTQGNDLFSFNNSLIGGTTIWSISLYQDKIAIFHSSGLAVATINETSISLDFNLLFDSSVWTSGQSTGGWPDNLLKLSRLCSYSNDVILVGLPTDNLYPEGSCYVIKLKDSATSYLFASSTITASTTESLITITTSNLIIDSKETIITGDLSSDTLAITDESLRNSAISINSDGQVVASVTTDIELNHLSGISLNVQYQIDNRRWRLVSTFAVYGTTQSTTTGSALGKSWTDYLATIASKTAINNALANTTLDYMWTTSGTTNQLVNIITNTSYNSYSFVIDYGYHDVLCTFDFMVDSNLYIWANSYLNILITMSCLQSYINIARTGWTETGTWTNYTGNNYSRSTTVVSNTTSKTITGRYYLISCLLANTGAAMLCDIDIGGTKVGQMDFTYVSTGGKPYSVCSIIDMQTSAARTVKITNGTTSTKTFTFDYCIGFNQGLNFRDVLCLEIPQVDYVNETTTNFTAGTMSRNMLFNQIIYKAVNTCQFLGLHVYYCPEANINGYYSDVISGSDSSYYNRAYNIYQKSIDTANPPN